MTTTNPTPPAIECSPEETLRQVYRDYQHSPLAVDWPLGETSSVEFGAQIKAFKMAMPYLSAPGSVVLDIGTGCGIAPRFFAKLGCLVVSVDSASASGMAALENVRLVGVKTEICDIERDPLPMESGSVDLIVFMDVIEHLHHSPKGALAEMMRVLRPGGIVLAGTPNAVRLTVRAKMLVGFSNWPKVWDYFDRPFSHYGHHHEYTMEEFRGVFEKTGFIIDKFCLDESNSLTASIGENGDLQSGIREKNPQGRSKFRVARRILWALATAVPRLRSSMVLVARKP